MAEKTLVGRITLQDDMSSGMKKVIESMAGAGKVANALSSGLAKLRQEGKMTAAEFAAVDKAAKVAENLARRKIETLAAARTEMKLLEQEMLRMYAGDAREKTKAMNAADAQLKRWNDKQAKAKTQAETQGLSQARASADARTRLDKQMAANRQRFSAEAQKEKASYGTYGQFSEQKQALARSRELNDLKQYITKKYQVQGAEEQRLAADQASRAKQRWDLIQSNSAATAKVVDENRARISSALGSVGSAMGNVSNRIMSTAFTWARRGALAASVGITGLGYAAITSSTALEKVFNSLKAIDGKKNKNLGQDLKFVRDYSNQTGRQIDEVAQASLGVRAMGLDPQVWVKTLSDLAIVKNVGIDSGLSILRQIQSGRVSGATRTLAGFGINGNDIFGIKPGKRVNVSDPTKYLNLLRDYVKKQYGGLAEESANTTGGITEQLKNTFKTASMTILGYDWNTGVFKVGSLMDGVKNALKSVRDFAKEVSESPWFSDPNKSIFDKLYMLFQMGMSKVETWWNSGGKQKVMQIFENTGKLLGGVMNGLFGAGPSGQDFWIDVGRSAGGAFFKGFTESFNLKGFASSPLGIGLATFGGISILAKVLSAGKSIVNVGKWLLALGGGGAAAAGGATAAATEAAAVGAGTAAAAGGATAAAAGTAAAGTAAAAGTGAGVVAATVGGLTIGSAVAVGAAIAGGVALLGYTISHGIDSLKLAGADEERYKRMAGLTGSSYKSERDQFLADLKAGKYDKPTAPATINITIPKLADSIHASNDADLSRIMQEMARSISDVTMNSGRYSASEAGR